MLGHRKLSAWYHQLAQQVEAGLPLAAAIRSSRGTGLPPRGTEAMAGLIETGGSIESAFALAEPWLPLADRLVLSAAAEAGRVPHALHSLSARHAQLGSAKLRLMLACAYPVGVLHFGLLLLPVVKMIDWEKGFTWDPLAYARMVAMTLVPLWSVIVVVAILIRRQNRVIAALGRALPFIGGYLRAQGIADFAFALGNFLDAGMLIDRAWAVAGSIATLPALRTAAAAMAPVIARGERPGSRIAAWPCFPPDFVALYSSGETTGQLEQNLLRLSTQYQERANRSLTLATIFYPAMVFLAVAGAVAYNVIMLYAGYLKMIEKMAS